MELGSVVTSSAKVTLPLATIDKSLIVDRDPFKSRTQAVNVADGLQLIVEAVPSPSNVL